jgi:hypothetical protein
VKKKIIVLLLVVVMVSLLSASLYALVKPNSFYDAISWTWTYNASATTSYNCLGYATGSMTWEWAWGSSNPTVSQVNTYLAGKGYSTSGSSAYILAYGPSTNVTHFSKVTASSTCRAKWGSLERFDHGSWSPYYSSSVYGSLKQKYYK